MLMHKKTKPLAGVKLRCNYCSPRWSGEITDCSMPVTFDQYDHCSYNCLYCFSWNQKSLKAYNTLFQSELGKEYQSLPIRAVSVKNVEDCLTQARETGRVGQFSDYFRGRYTIQWGGLCDPFDNFEKKNGVGLEILKLMKRHNYPICFSTKATWWTEDDRYMSLFKGQSNWNVKFSIINLDEDIAGKIEQGVPSPAERLLALRRVARIGAGGATLRLRPFIIGMSDVNNQHIELVRKAGEMGATALSTEFFCLEDRAHPGTVARYDEISKALGFDIREFYKRNSPGMCGYLRLNYKLKQKYVYEMRDVAHAQGMKFAISDAHWKDLNDTLSCCGLDDRKFKVSEGQYTALLVNARRRWNAGERDILITWPMLEKHLGMFKKFRFIYAEGFNTVGTERRTKYWNDTMYDYLHTIWNTPNSAKAPYKYFYGLMVPVSTDANGDIVYKYKPYEEK